MRPFLIRALWVFAVLVVAACSKPASDSAGATPDGAINAAVGHLRDGDFVRFVNAAVPPSEVERMRANWEKAMREEPTSDEEAEDFRASMRKLSAPDAVDVLMAELEPKLVKFETETAPQIPLNVGMGRGLVLSGIQESQGLTAEQKAQLGAVVEALGNWLTATPFTERTRVRQALGHIVDSARALDVAELDELRGLSLDDALLKGGRAWNGAAKALAVYGLSIEETLASTSAETVRIDGDRATVRVRAEFLGKPLSADIEMVRIDGRWYSKPLIDGIAARSAEAAADTPSAG